MGKLLSLLFFALVLGGFPDPLCGEEIISHRFGEVSPDRIQRTALFVPAEIIHVVPLCECVAAYAAPENGGTRLTVEFDPAGYRGDTTQELMLMDADRQMIRVRLHARVRNEEKTQ
ncbi:MAG: hypothetical protein GF333_03760 [Candidatus Omnitrophica bacterium]|nr:hypothetical protein [Candidatus Omnitrophota bacterium]